jgi:hypothetical protein
MTNTSGATQPGRRRPKLKLSNVQPENLCFVIGRPRSGTTVFKTMLQTHPEIWSFGEVLNESNPRSYFHFLKRLQVNDRDAVLPSRSVGNFVAYLEWCRKISIDRQPSNKLVVMDVKYDQAHLLCEPWWSINSLPRIFSLMRELGCKVIDVHRRDLVGLIISNRIAIQTKIYHSNKLDPGEGQQARVRIDPERLVREVSATAKAYDKVSRHFRGYPEYMLVEYEEMFESEEFSSSLILRVSKFLGVSNQFERKPQLSKLLVDDIFSYIENGDEVREHLARQAAVGRPLQATTEGR